MDMESDKVESRESNQRFRIYRTIALNLFGRETFEHFEYKNVSSYILVNRKGCENIEIKRIILKICFLKEGLMCKCINSLTRIFSDLKIIKPDTTSGFFYIFILRS